jgi:membrane protease YdiL (CAAX protease family)
VWHPPGVANVAPSGVAVWHPRDVARLLSALIRRWRGNTISGRPGLELISALVIAPLLEELVFRAAPRRMSGWWPTAGLPVALASAAAFGLMHARFGRWFAAYAGAGGLVLWATYARAGLVGAVLLHLAANVADLSLGWRRWLKAAS